MNVKFKGVDTITSSKYYTRLPKQVQRALPIYCIVILILFLLNIGSIGHGVASVGRGIYSGAPQHPHKIFPRKIWQTWKVDPLGFEERDLSVAKTWTTKNPGHRYEVLTDSNDMYYVETYYGPNGFNRPDIVNVYRSLTLRIIKADLLRYLVMYAEGGLYTDIDVEALKPVSKFIPQRYDESEIDMVVGIEIDQPDFNSHPVLGKKSQSFCQWTFMCKPQLPVMLHLVDSIIAWLQECSRKQGVPIEQLELDFDEVISGTGPSAFTKILLKDIGRQVGRTVKWDEFHALYESKLVGGVLVLTVEAFAAGQGHSDSGNHNAKTAMVKHRYHASNWPTKHPRYKHPVYGEVERCNWVKECVKLWDLNTAKFEKLPLDEKAKLIALKEIQDVNEQQKMEAEAADLKALAQAPAFPPQRFPAAPVNFPAPVVVNPAAVVDNAPAVAAEAPIVEPPAPAPEQALAEAAGVKLPEENKEEVKAANALEVAAAQGPPEHALAQAPAVPPA